MKHLFGENAGFNNVSQINQIDAGFIWSKIQMIGITWFLGPRKAKWS